MTEHSPLPWRGDKSGFLLAPDGKREVQVAKIGDFFDKELLPFNRKRWEADRDLIIKAVNNHAALVNALEVLLEEATNFSVSGVYFDEDCMGHKGPTLARQALAAVSTPLTPGDE